MIEIKINSKNQVSLSTRGNGQEILENIRCLDTVRELIILDLKDKMHEEALKNSPNNLSVEELNKKIDEMIGKLLKDMDVLCEVQDNE